MMHFEVQRSTTRLAAAAFLVLLACLAGLSLILLAADPDRVARRTWQGYYTVLVDRAGNTQAVAEAIGRSRGVQAVVSRYTSRVSFNTFGGFGSSTVADLRHRLDPVDPRLDPYLARLSRFFSLRDGDLEWEIFYVRSALPRWRAVGLLAAAAGSLRWASPDFDPWGTGLRLVLLAAFAAVLAVRTRSVGTALVLAVGALPWVAAALVGTYASLLLFVLAAPLWLELLPRVEHSMARRAGVPTAARGARWSGSPGLYFLGPVGLALAAVLLIVVGEGCPLLPLVVPAASGVLLVPLQAVVTLRSSRRPMHPVFRAVPILTRLRRRRPRLERRVVLNLLLLGLAAGTLAAVAMEHGTGGRPSCYAPAPVAGAGAGISWRGLQKLAAAGSPGDPPTLADYLSHRAYQEGLPFGRGYGLPSPGERVAVTYYLAGSGGPELVQTRRVVKRFQVSWLEETLAAAPPGSVERLLLDQGFATRVRWEPASGRPWSALAAVATLLFLASFLFGPDFRLTPPHLYVTTRLTLRRSHHPS
jgi:hypothetical protein